MNFKSSRRIEQHRRPSKLNEVPERYWIHHIEKWLTVWTQESQLMTFVAHLFSTHLEKEPYMNKIKCSPRLKATRCLENDFVLLLRQTLFESFKLIDDSTTIFTMNWATSPPLFEIRDVKPTIIWIIATNLLIHSTIPKYLYPMPQKSI